MEVFRYYKGYGIRYTELGGTTYVENLGYPIQTFRGEGYSEGKRLAEKFIDELTKIGGKKTA